MVILVAVGLGWLGFRMMRPEPAVVPVASVEEPKEVEPPVEVNPAFQKTADRLTFGTGYVPAQTEPELERVDRMLRQIAALPEGSEKTLLVQEVARLNDRAVVPVLLNWATTTPDRMILRATTTALGRFGDGEMIGEIERRYREARSYDDRYRLAKIIAGFTNPEAVPALIALANADDVPVQLAVAAADGLATVGTGPAVSVLLQKLTTEPAEESPRLETTIGRINRPEALPALQDAARGNKDAPSIRGQVAAIHALVNFSDEQTLALLGELSGNSAEEVRTAAKVVMGRLGGK